MAALAYRWMIAVASATAIYAAPALAQKQEVNGIVVSNRNGQLVVKTPSGDQTISLPADTRVRSVSGALGGQKEVVPMTSLIPGLPVNIELDASGAAHDIEYKAKDFKTSDRIRDELLAQGILLEDGPKGTTWRRS